MAAGLIAASRRRTAIVAQAYYTVESVGPTTNALSYADIADLGTINLAAGTNYIGFYSTEVQANTSTSGVTATQVLVNGATVEENFGFIANIAYTKSHGGTFIIQNPGAATTATVKVQGKRTVVDTATFTNTRLTVLKLSSNDNFVEDRAGTTLTNTTTNKTNTIVATVNFTPPTTGDYIIICSFLPSLTNTTNVSFAFSLTDGTNSTTEQVVRPSNGSQGPCVAIWPRSSLSGAQSISLQIRQSNSGTTTIGASEIRITAIRADRFANIYKTRLAANSVSTTTTYVNALTQTFTPSAADHLTLANWYYRSSGTESTQFTDGGTQLVELSAVQESANSNVGANGFVNKVATYAATSRTQNIDRKSTASTSTVYADAEIISFDLSGL